MRYRYFIYFIIILLILSLSLLGEISAKEKPKPLFEDILTAIEKRNYPYAIDKLLAFKEKFPQKPWGGRCLYLLGHCYFKIDDMDKALLFYEESKKRYPELEDYASYSIARIWSEKEDYKKEIESLKRFLKLYPNSRLLPNVFYRLAHAHFLLEDYENASHYYKEFIERYEEDEKVTKALYGLGSSFEKIGDYHNAFFTYQTLYIDFPEDSLSGLSLRRMKEIKRKFKFPQPLYLPSQQFKRAERLLQAKKYRRARHELMILAKDKGEIGEESLFLLAMTYSKIRRKGEAAYTLKRFIRQYPESSQVPRAYYEIGSILWNGDSNSKSKSYLEKLIQSYPKSRWAEKGLYVLGRIAEDEKKYEDSLKFYSRLLNDFPEGSLRNDAQWKRGWVYYITERHKDAHDDFHHLVKNSRLLPDVNRKGLYWQGRAAEKTGKKELAVSLYKRLIQNHPHSYYGYAGKERLKKIAGEKTALDGLPSIEKATDLVSKAFINQPLLKKDEKYHFIRARELIELGFFKDAGKEMDVLSRMLPLEPKYLFFSGEWYYRSGFYLEAIRRLNEAYIRLSEKERNRLPKRFWEIYYPKTPWSKIKLYAERHGLDPYLVLSVIRQESAFEPEAVSRAGAVGLMQLLPSTARRLSRRLKIRRFNRSMLFEPDINISLGTLYLSDLIKRYDGNLVFALAGYNAGENRVDKWLKERDAKEIDLFIEEIPYYETRGYVKKILRNSNNYRAIYKNEG